MKYDLRMVLEEFKLVSEHNILTSPSDLFHYRGRHLIYVAVEGEAERRLWHKQYQFM